MKTFGKLNLLLLFVAQASMAQHFGGHPASQRWNEVNTDTVRVIFQPGLEEEASRVAHLEHRLAHYHNPYSIGNKFRKINIVMQNRTTVSNGFVTLNPWHSEFFVTPLADAHVLGTLPFFDVLAMHEYRHVQQNSNMLRGWNKIPYFLMGQPGWQLGSILTVPLWFFEGDAVVNETRFTHQGRGRLPAFYDGPRALYLDHKRYSYMKTRNGSYKDFVPDHYKYGYQMTLFAYENHGPDLWAKTLKGNFRAFPAYPFTRALNNEAGYGTRMLYKKTYDKFSEKSDEQVKSLEQDNAEKVNKVRKHTYTNYDYPQTTANGDIIALKTAYNHIAKVIRISPDGKETTLTYQGYTQDAFISHRNGKVTWCEYSMDPRWQWRDYMDVVVYDIESDTKRRLTSKGRLFTPDLSPDSKKVAAIEVGSDNHFALVILNTENGEVIKKISSPENYYYSYPRWDSTAKHLYVTVRDQQGLMSIQRISASTYETETLLPFLNQTISQVEVSGDKLFYTASYDGFNNIYAYDLSSKRYYRQNHSFTSSFWPRVQGNTLYYNVFSRKGSDLFKTTLRYDQVSEPTPLDKLSQYASPVYTDHQDDLPVTTDTTQKLPSKKYHQAAHSLNIYKWGLIADGARVGLNLGSFNILNNLTIDVQGGYNRNEDKSFFLGDINYAGLYTVLNAGITNLGRKYTIDTVARDTFQFRETVAYGNVSVPLNFVRGLYTTAITPTVGYSYRFFDTIATNFQSAQAGILFSRARKKAYQHIASHFGQYVFLRYNTSLDNADIYQQLAQSEFTFPGIFANHHLAIQADYQLNGTGTNYRFTDLFYYPKGYGKIFNDEIYRVGAAYHFPVLYPDLGFGGLFYLKRIRANVFFDYAVARSFIGDNKEARAEYNSVGPELVFDCQILNLIPISFFMRMAYRSNPGDKDPWQFEAGIPVIRVK